MAEQKQGQFDLVVLGGGMGGYVAAIRASQLGLRTAIVEAKKLGGTCLHVGCIPTKALLESSGLFEKLHRGQEFGIVAETLAYDYDRIAARRDRVVDQLYKGVQGLMRKNKIEVVQGWGRLKDKNTVEVDGRHLQASNLLLATGSEPKSLPNLQFDGERILNSDHAAKSSKVPESVAIIGAGAVGVEFATFYRQMGIPVTVVEALDRLVPLEDEEVSAELLKHFQRAGIEVRLGAKVQEAKKNGNGVTVRLEEGEVKAEVVLVAVGRGPVTRDTGIQEAGVELTQRGDIKVDEWMRTSVDGIHAIGDVVGGYLLAHAASHEGIVAVEDIAGKRMLPMEQALVTRCTYCQPQITSVGLTETQARGAGREVKVGKFPFVANGRALIHGEPGGFVKVVADARSGQLLGTHIIGVEATELIAEPALTQLFQGDAWEMGRNIHPHPTLSEALGEAVLAVQGEAIHI